MDNLFEMLFGSDVEISDISDDQDCEKGGLVYEVDGQIIREGGLVGATSTYYPAEGLTDFEDYPEYENVRDLTALPSDESDGFEDWEGVISTPTGVGDEESHNCDSPSWNGVEQGGDEWV